MRYEQEWVYLRGELLAESRVGLEGSVNVVVHNSLVWFGEDWFAPSISLQYAWDVVSVGVRGDIDCCLWVVAYGGLGIQIIQISRTFIMGIEGVLHRFIVVVGNCG